MLTVYIASPYTRGDVGQNVLAQLDTANILMDHGVCPIVPLFAQYQHMRHPRDYEDWITINIEKLRRCDVLVRLPGKSSGADEEVKYAEENGIPVVYGLLEFIDKVNTFEERCTL